jgi:cation diffusion facilitator family transporter
VSASGDRDRRPLDEKKTVALWSIAASGGLALAKLLAGLATGSLGLISEAAHSLLDLGATTITYWAVSASEQPADSRHLYGHAKIESVAALVETGLLFVTALGVTIEASRRLLGKESPVEVTWWALALLVISIAVDYSRSRSLRRVARETSSAALEADSVHFEADMVSSISVLIGLGLVGLGFRSGDALAALLVAAIIGLAGWRLGQRTIDTLMDAAPEGVVERVERIALANEGVLRAERVRARPAGATLFIDAEIAVARTLPFDRVSAIKASITDNIRKTLPNADLSLSVVPIELDDETAFDKVMLIASRRGLAVHHVTIQRIGERLAVGLDLEVDGQMALAKAHELATDLEDAIEAELGHGVEVESHIEPMQMSAVAGSDVPEPLRGQIARTLTELAGFSGFLTDIHDVRARQTPQGLYVTVHCRARPEASVQSVHEAVDDLERRFRERMPEVRRLIGHAEPPAA